MSNIQQKMRFTAHEVLRTGTSRIWTTPLVLLVPIVLSHKIRAKKSTTSSATEAGNATELRLMRLSTPQQASSAQKAPIGTQSQANNVLRHANWATYYRSIHIAYDTQETHKLRRLQGILEPG